MIILPVTKVEARIVECHPWYRLSWGSARECYTTNDTITAVQYQDRLANKRCVRPNIYSVEDKAWFALLGSQRQDHDEQAPLASCSTVRGTYGKLRTLYIDYHTDGKVWGALRIYDGINGKVFCNSWPKEKPKHYRSVGYCNAVNLYI